jgi:uncharacterized protein YndB with AHSA1/START domain
MPERKRSDSVSIEISAPPKRVYELVSDITRMGEWSPECVECRWAKDATGASVGAHFRAKNKGRRGPAWFNMPEVKAADPGRTFAFNRKGPGVGSYTWRYDFEPMDTGTKLTESFEAEKPLSKAMSWVTMKWTGSSDRDADLHQGMLTTLSRIKAAAEKA